MRTGGAAGRCLAALAVTALTGGCEPPAEAPPPPRLVFSETEYDFGRVSQGSAVEHRFVFRNEGGTPLSVIKLRTACDCEATLVGDEVQPDAVGVVVARCDLDAVYGPQRRTVTVFSNDPAQRAVMLVLRGAVLLEAAADPPQVYLGKVPSGAPRVGAVVLRRGSEGVHFGKPRTDAPQLTAKLTEAGDGTGTVWLTFGTAPGTPPGPFTAQVRVPTSSARHPAIVLPVAGIVTLDAPFPPEPVATGRDRAISPCPTTRSLP